MTGILDRPDEPESQTPQCRMWDAPELNIPNIVTIPTAGRASFRLDVGGYRRFRLKWRITDNMGGVSTVNLRLVDVPFSRVQAWEIVNVGPFPYGANGANVYNFGQGTGVLECFTGQWLLFVLFNNGPGLVVFQECELWAGA